MEEETWYSMGSVTSENRETSKERKWKRGSLCNVRMVLGMHPAACQGVGHRYILHRQKFNNPGKSLVRCMPPLAISPTFDQEN